MFQHSVNFYIVTLCLYITNIDGQKNNTNVSLSKISRNKDARHNVYETDGFTDGSVTSGPLLVIDKKNIFIPNLNYDPEDQDTYFWVGTGKPSPTGVLVPDENNSNSSLKSYQGRNIYLQLPENLSADKIDYISVWSIVRKISLGHVMLYKNPTFRRKIPDALGYHNRTEDGRTIYRAPFCCEVNEIYNKGGTCTKVPADLPLKLSVFESNETFVDYESVLENVEIVPYKYKLECTEPGYIPNPLYENDTYGLVYNSTLYLLNEPGTFSHGSFCIAYNREQVVHVCIFYGLEPNGTLYMPFLIISTICFIISTLVYIFVIKEKNVHRKCFMGYSLSMIIVFITLACLQKKSPACDCLGALFMLSLLSSYVWFACLCVDLIFLVKTPKSVPEDTSRFYMYLSISLAIPLLILGASIIPDGTLDVPQSFVKDYSGPNYCRFEGTNNETFLMTISLLMLLSAIALGYTCYTVNKSDDPEDFSWIQNKSQFKFQLRSYFLVWVTTFIWLIEIAANMLVQTTNALLAIHLIEALQGVYVITIFVLNKYIRKEIYNVVCMKKLKIEQQQKFQNLVETLDKPNVADEENDTRF